MHDLNWHQKRTICVQLNNHCHHCCPPSPSVHSLHLVTIQSVTTVLIIQFISLSTAFFNVFLGLTLCLVSSTFKVIYFSSNHHHNPFLKCVHTVAIYFFVPLLCTSTIPIRCLNSTQDSLLPNFTPHIQLSCVISGRCSVNSCIVNH